MCLGKVQRIEIPLHDPVALPITPGWQTDSLTARLDVLTTVRRSLPAVRPWLCRGRSRKTEASPLRR